MIGGLMTKYNELAIQLNSVLEKKSPVLFELLSDFGKRLYFPRGIVTQTEEAKGQAKTYNATIGIATEGKGPMHLPSVKKYFDDSFEAKELFPYAPTKGLPKLRELWKEKLFTDNPELQGKSLSSPLVTQAITHGLSLAADMFFNPGDPVILHDKFWGNYKFIWNTRHQSKFVQYPLFNKDLTSFNLEAFQKTLEDYKGKKQILVFNFPNNPTGFSISKEEALAIRESILNFAQQGSKFVVLCDDAYFGMNWEKDIIQESIFAYLADLHENVLCIKTDGVTKEGFMWGFRVGFLTYSMKGMDSEAYDALETKTAGAIRSSTSTCSHPSQSVALKALTDPEFPKELAHKKSILQERYSEMKKHIQSGEYKDLWTMYPCQSGYFLSICLKDVNAESLRVHLLKKHGVGVISTNATDIRIAYSCVEKKSIEDMVKLLAKSVKELKAS